LTVCVANPEGARFVPRPIDTALASGDHDAQVSALIYRDKSEYAVGHTCSATWSVNEGEVGEVSTTWVPRCHVPSMSANGHALFEKTRTELDVSDAFEAAALHQADKAKLRTMLEVIPKAYETWLDEQEADVLPSISSKALGDIGSLRGIALESLKRARMLVSRLRGGIELIDSDARVRLAFQLSQQAMARQAKWRNANRPLVWRPFQLAFQLLNLAGVADPSHPERDVMDLLWFPTGGGKTEAYLGLSAFTLFHRRLRDGDESHGGRGVSIIMRYTLRLLTMQQFERAAAMVIACESIRLENASLGLGDSEFGVGLWVGNNTTPKTVKKARSDGSEMKNAKQLLKCPCCQSKLRWDEVGGNAPFIVACRGRGCTLPEALRDALPVYTIDELVYEKQPSLLFGTVDKFAQIVRNEQTVNLFGAGLCPPPELIIQDELHLISGPLGTLFGLYEAAIDRICEWNGRPAKVIGSTATIRRAEDQVRRLFNREVEQFPPPVLNASDSCFAITDPELPGRVYLGVTTAGRSPKFTLQAASAALLQRTTEQAVVPKAHRDPWWTLLIYFNSLRELGGALVMMHDDVPASCNVLSSLHGTVSAESGLGTPKELTSRIESGDIPKEIDLLCKSWKVAHEGTDDQQDIRTVLATNMVSVGVDIPRLGLMVVNGQPKSMSEYIQASSRVGRNDVPGLILTVYTAHRPRDLSHFESFQTWHQALYRSVEATSVTPFAPRARDRALHATMVALMRHLIRDLRPNEDSPKRFSDFQDEVAVLQEWLLDRIDEVDPRERCESKAEIERFWRRWCASKRTFYWNERHLPQSLLVGAEKAAMLRAKGKKTRGAHPTPNSLRTVEASTTFRLKD
jgi:hypothetical protein